MNVIDEIIENKKKILEKTKAKKDLSQIKKEAFDYRESIDEKFRFQSILKKDKTTKLICEYKPASPSKGDISNLDVTEVIKIYDETPVDMISVITEKSYFKSNFRNFQIANENTRKPLLRKDFVIDEYMIYEAAANNASCILLIEGVCPDMEKYLNITYELGIDAIVECHSKDDLENVVDLNPQIIGVNNRNLNDLTINLDTTKYLREYVPNYMISESGVNTLDDARLLKSYKADALLIGTSILRKNNPSTIKSYIRQLHNVLI